MRMLKFFRSLRKWLEPGSSCPKDYELSLWPKSFASLGSQWLWKCWDWASWKGIIVFFSLFGFVLLLFRATPMAYGSSQTRGRIGATAASLHHSHSNGGIQAASVTYTTAHGNIRSPTHWVRPGIEPASSWILVGLVSSAPRRELLFSFNKRAISK